MESRVWIFFTFLLYLGIGYGTATVSIIGENGTVSFDSSSLEFGPNYRWTGYTFEGYLEYVTPHSACKMITKKNESSEIALIALSTLKDNCTFETKVLNAQRVGFMAAIVFNTEDNGLVEMRVSKPGGHDISTITSVFVDLSAGVELQAATFETGATVKIVIEIEGIRYFLYFATWFTYSLYLSGISICVFNCVVRCMNARRRRRSSMSRTNRKRIPTKKFHEAYHQYSKRVCPVCKRRVSTKKRAEPRTENASDERKSPIDCLSIITCKIRQVATKFSQRWFEKTVTRSFHDDEDMEARARADLPAVPEAIVVPLDSPPLTRHTTVTPSSNYSTPAQSSELPAGFTPYMKNTIMGSESSPLPPPGQAAAMFGAKKEGAKAANRGPDSDDMGACTCTHEYPGEEDALLAVKVEIPSKQKKEGKKLKMPKTDHGEGKGNGGLDGSGTNRIV